MSSFVHFALYLQYRQLYIDPVRTYHIGLTFPAKMGPCVNESCAGLIVSDDGLVHSVSAVPVTNLNNRDCVYFNDERLNAGSCNGANRFICQYDWDDPTGIYKIVSLHK